MPPLPDPDELEASLRNDLVDRWFPACIDPDGGYRQNFDAEFRPTGDATKSLVFQSRMLWVCATVAQRRGEFYEYADHGVRFILDRMSLGDGAFAWEVDAQGPLSEEVHAYGLSFALYGLAAAARYVSGDPLEAIGDLFRYLERSHHDPVHGGYFETSVAGKPKLEGDGQDAIGTRYGLKSQNTHLHLMEAFTERLYDWPNPLLEQRLAETVDIIAHRLFAEPGHLTLFAQPDWTPDSSDISYGHDIEAAHLLLAAEEALRSPLVSTGRWGRGEEGAILAKAVALATATLSEGWDVEAGGVFNAGGVNGPTDRRKIWWVQAEALLGFAALWRRTGDPRYADALTRQWSFIRDHQIDRRHGGWFEESGRPEMPKGHAWKAAYHDGRALLFTARLLREASSSFRPGA